MDADPIELFRHYIDQVLAETGWHSTTEIARKSGISPSTINRPYNKKDIAYLPGLRTINAVARASGVRPPPELVGGASPSTDPGSGDMQKALRAVLIGLLEVYDAWQIIEQIGAIEAEARARAHPHKRA
jgi:AcrR family transcriptional regulator